MGVLTATGVVLIGWTLHETRRAVGEATSATKAAQEAVEVTREIGEAQVRGYFTITKVAMWRPPEGSDGCWSVKVVLTNSGLSPGRNVRGGFDVTANIINMAPDGSRYYEPITVVASAYGSLPDAVPDKSVDLIFTVHEDWWQAWPEDVARHQTSLQSLSLDGQVRVKDVFGWVTRFTIVGTFHFDHEAVEGENIVTLHEEIREERYRAPRPHNDLGALAT